MLLTCSAIWGCTAGAAPKKDNGRPPPVVPSGGTLLQGAGATFPEVLYDTWFRQYQAAHPNDVITYDAVGSGEGVRRFIGGRSLEEGEGVDFGASDAAMRDEEMTMVPAGVVLVPLTAGSVALAYNLPGIAELRLSRAAYVGLFTGQIKKWNDSLIARANPGMSLPNLTVSTVVRQDGSGTTFAFTKHLDAISDGWRSRYGAATLVDWPSNSMRAIGNEGMAARIQQSVGSIGYVGYESAVRAGVTTALLENRSGTFVRPGGAAAVAALEDAELPDNLRVYVPDPVRPDAYPIVTLTWVLLYRNYDQPRKADELRRLFQWCLTDGQAYAADLGYIPLPRAIQQRSLAALDTIRSSTRF
jgi:phosphate transport system substrate-binding protein